MKALLLGIVMLCSLLSLPATRARVASDLHAAIQDAFNRHGVQIMSPHYYRDPKAPKIVAEADWHAPPAEQRDART